MVQIGDAGGVETTGYLGSTSDDNSNATNYSSGYLEEPTNGTGSAIVRHGTITLTLENASSFTWAASVNIGKSNIARTGSGGGSKSLSAELDRVRITTSGGTDTFDAGEINITFEGTP